MPLFASPMSSLMKCLFPQIFRPFFIELSSSYYIVSSLYILDMSFVRYLFCKYFPSLWLAFSFLQQCLLKSTTFILMSPVYFFL